MKLATGLVGRGPTYLFRGLRKGDVGLFSLGVVLMLVRLRRWNRSRPVTTLTLKAGESVALRVTRRGADPVSYRIGPRAEA